MLTSYIFNFPTKQFRRVFLLSPYLSFVKTDVDNPFYPSEKQTPKITWKRHMFFFKDTGAGKTLEVIQSILGTNVRRVF